MNSRIVTNLIFFAALGVLLSIWAVTSIITVDALRRPVTVTAEFASSPGLRADLEVAYLGVRVGSVGDVDLRPGRVAVQLKLDRGATVPAAAHAAVLRKSVMGEPYVALTPPSGPGGRPLRAGDHIPLSRTSVTVEYKKLFDSAGDLLRAIPPRETRTLTSELATGLEGRGGTLRDLMGDAHQLTGTLAAESSVLDSLSVQLTQLTGTLAASGPELGSGVNDLAAFTATLKDSRNDLDSVLRRGPGLVDQVNGTLEASRPGMRCMLHALGVQSPPLFTPEASRLLRHSLTVFGTRIPDVTDSVVEPNPEGTHVRFKVVLDFAGPVGDPDEYGESLIPAKPPLYECAGNGRQVAAPPPGTGEKGTPALKQGPFTAEASPAADREPGTSPSSRWLPLLPILAAALVLGVAAGRLGTAIRRRHTS
ncbi:MCE family protein [Actinomadura sp. 7K507]|uniref:MCE family protein n=1 Tax=Actinomadura sp. 7K507 TaxID=2530365 RepID=UPI001404A37B|nr:MCE family protein [Actinomadura sp. 7K507]